MAPEIAQLEHPIDVMSLIHKAIRAEARRTRQAAEHLEMGGNFKPFVEVFYGWAMALGHHEAMEYQYIMPFVPDSSAVQHNGMEHKALLEGLENLQTRLHEELGRTIVIPRTQRHLIGDVIALLIAQADLLEEEEVVILPVIRQHISYAQQVEMARHLLLDPEAEDPEWVLDWVAQHLTASERQILEALVAHFEVTPRALGTRSDADGESRQDTSTSSMGSPAVMVSDSPRFAQPINVMYLLHKALSTDAWHAETMVESLEVGADLQPCLQALQYWERALGFHAAMEDAYMTPLLPASAAARDNEAGHQRLGQRLDDLRAYVRTIADQPVTARTRRHLFGKVVALRIDQDDHLEEEEELVLPLIRERFTEAQQCDMVRHLLFDPQASDTRWVLDWVGQDLTDLERQAFAYLVARLTSQE